LSFDTQYYWQVVPYNVIGDTPNCPVWSFTTRQDGVLTIGTGTEVNTHLPIETGSGYTYTQSLYYPEDFGTGGLISSLAYNYNGAFTLANSNNWTIYMGLTTVDSFNSPTDWIPTSQMTVVYNGVVPQPTGAGWIELDLIDDFFYDGTSNLVIAVDENQTGNGSPNEEFFCTSTSSARSIYYFTSVSNIDPNTPPTATNTSAYIPNVRMNMLTLGNFPYVLIDTTEIEFGIQDLGSPSAPVVIEISNLGFADTIIDPMIDLTGVGADQFVLTDNNTYPLAIPQFVTASIECYFNPTTQGHKEALITITDNVTRDIHQIPLHGYSYLADGNDTSETASNICDYATDNIEIPAIIMPDNDVDWYVFWQTGPADVEIHTTNLFGSTIDLAAYLYGPYNSLGLTVSDAPLVMDDNTFDGVNPQIDTNLADSGYYYLKIETSTMDRTERWDTNDYSLFINRPYTVPPAALPPTGLQADITYQGITLMWEAPETATRQLVGYNVYRDDVMLNTETVTTLLYRDPFNNLVVDQTYEYEVTALYDMPLAESDPSNTITETFTFIAPPLIAEEFETYDNFSTEFGYWTSLDEDGQNTQTLDNGVDFQGEGTPMSFMIFNPTATTPPLQNADALSGTKYAACFDATTGPNDDWLITPRIQASTDAINLTFYARSFTTEFGMEQFEIGVSTTNSTDPSDFTIISGDQPIDVPLSWTLFEQDLSTYSGQEIRVGIHCVSNQAYFMMLDDLMIINENGALDNESQPDLPQVTMLNGNYPNPFNPETTISFSLKENADVTIDIFNIKGQKIDTVANGSFPAGSHNIIWKGDDSNGRKVASGIYFYKMHSGKYSKTRKMILMK
jgi:hypothetical protein